MFINNTNIDLEVIGPKGPTDSRAYKVKAHKSMEIELDNIFVHIFNEASWNERKKKNPGKFIE